jgi:2-polyprenyl-6-methoxyphenol hydroxylase-like FAD-dependent oxidoreductase
MSIPANCDVLIVGAGPTGLMLANQLVRRGITPVIIDRHPGPSIQTKALGVHARTMEIYAKLGIAERAVELGLPTRGGNMWPDGRFGARIPFGDIGRGLSPYPYILILGQDDNERLLGELLRRQNVQVQWGTELMQLEQGTNDVRVTLRQADGSIKETRARWVAGCDGAHSAVRTLNGIGFPGAPYEHVFFVADTTATGPMVPDELNIYLWKDGFHLFFPMRGRNHWRIVGILPAELRGREDLKFDAVVPSLRQYAGTALAFSECSWFSTYRIHHRHAERFRDRRCFLLGDAAHIHSPVGAQGMNTGLQDAYNLGWKLALVVAGRADASLLDTYEAERLPVAERLLETTDRGFALVVSDSFAARLLRTRVIAKVAALAMRFERVRKLAFRTISQIGIRYPQSRLSEDLPGLPETSPRAGERFPWLRLKFVSASAPEDLYNRLDDTCFNLIVIGQPALPAEPPELTGLLRTHRIADDPGNARILALAGISSPAWYLLRPDGHVGLAGTTLDAAVLRRYLTERLTLRQAGTAHVVPISRARAT